MAGGVEGGEVAGPCISSAGRGTVTEKVTSKQNLEGCQLAELEWQKGIPGRAPGSRALEL